MSMWNPFKKKEEKEFKLDDTSLPSLNEIGDLNDENNFSEDNEATPSVPQLPNLNEPNFENPADSLSGISMPEPISSLEKPLENSNENVSSNENSRDIHSEISKTKIEALDSKVALVDARLSNMEAKLEMIFQMMANEISDETKRKLKVESMMKNIK